MPDTHSSRTAVLDGHTRDLFRVVLDPDGTVVELPRQAGHILHGVPDGTVLQIPVTHGVLDWANARVDHAATAQRITDARARLDRLGATDDGGDVTLG